MRLIVPAPPSKSRLPAKPEHLFPVQCPDCGAVFEPDEADLLSPSPGDVNYFADCPNCKHATALSSYRHEQALDKIAQVLGVQSQAESPVTQQPKTPNTKDPNGSIR